MSGEGGRGRGCTLGGVEGGCSTPSLHELCDDVEDGREEEVSGLQTHHLCGDSSSEDAMCGLVDGEDGIVGPIQGTGQY